MSNYNNQSMMLALEDLGNAFLILPTAKGRNTDKLMVRINTLKVMEATLAVFPLVSVLRPFNFAPFWHEIQEALPDEEGHESVQ
eukprot:scaffold75019_cov20-Tisochrysis_lutea.AAC.1